MRLDKVFKILLVFLFLNVSIYAKEQINMSFKGLEIKEFAKIVAKILDKNILFTTKIKGKVDFESNKPIYKEDLINVFVFVLESKGYTVVDNDGILRIVRISDVAKYNVPIYNNSENIPIRQMVTEIFNIKYANVDYVSSKVRHLLSKSAKLVTDKESNAIVLTDFPANIKTIKKAIRLIAKDTKKDIEVVTLKNIKGNSILSDLRNVAKTVFNEKILNEKVDILLNKDTNSIMFVGKKENIKFLVKYLKNIDSKDSLVKKVVDVIYLKNAESKSVIKIVNSIIAKKIYKDKNNRPFASTDDESNSIIFMGPKEEIAYFKELIKKLDIDRQQVYVKARIIEVSQLGSAEVGIKYGLIAGNANQDAGLMTLATKMGGDAIAIDPNSMGLEIPSLTKGLALGATISLLNQNGAADIVSEPSLLCINNKESSIYVGETRSIKTGTTTTSGGNIQDTYKREDIGLTLKVKPRISNGGKVLLDILTKLEDVGQTTTNGQPNTSKKDLQTTAIVNNGESIILGGYIKSKKEHTIDKVPFLGDIPVLGGLFKNKKRVDDKINLVIIITPYIVPKSKDLTYVRDQLARLKLLEDKYTKDAILRLKEAKLKAKEDDLKREDKMKDLQEKEEDLKDNNHNDVLKLFGL